MLNIINVEDRNGNTVETKRFQSNKKAQGYVFANYIDTLLDHTWSDELVKSDRAEYGFISARVHRVVVNN